MINLPGAEFLNENQGITQVTFRSQGDSKVCPICDELDGTTYNTDDPDMPIIPEDTHPNCRCFYEDTQLGGEVPIS